MGTFGPAFNEELDGERVGSQLQRVRDLMIDGVWRTLGEIATLTRDPESSVSAQLRHLRKKRFGSFRVDKRRRGAPSNGLYEYKLLPPDPDEAVEPEPEVVVPEPSKEEIVAFLGELTWTKQKRHKGVVMWLRHRAGLDPEIPPLKGAVQRDLWQ
jgi:hypothetical protein